MNLDRRHQARVRAVLTQQRNRARANRPDDAPALDRARLDRQLERDRRAREERWRKDRDAALVDQQEEDP